MVHVRAWDAEHAECFLHIDLPSFIHTTLLPTIEGAFGREGVNMHLVQDHLAELGRHKRIAGQWRPVANDVIAKMA